MDKVYKQLTKYMVNAGKRIAKRAGQIDDIGVTKRYLTEEDLKIERGFKAIIKTKFPNHEFFSEEENDKFSNSDNVWISDPISGTRTFIKGLAHYGMVISHVQKGDVLFASVYDPSNDDLYVAYKNKGTFLNGNRLQIKEVKRNKIKVL